MGFVITMVNSKKQQKSIHFNQQKLSTNLVSEIGPPSLS